MGQKSRAARWDMRWRFSNKGFVDKYVPVVATSGKKIDLIYHIKCSSEYLNYLQTENIERSLNRWWGLMNGRISRSMNHISIMHNSKEKHRKVFIFLPSSQTALALQTRLQSSVFLQAVRHSVHPQQSVIKIALILRLIQPKLVRIQLGNSH